VVAAAAATAGKFGYLAAAGTETGLFYAPAGVALWVGVVASDGTNTVISQGTDGQVLVQQGSAAAPSIAAANDPDTGLSLGAVANRWYLVAGGAATMQSTTTTATFGVNLNMATKYLYSADAILSLGSAVTSTHALGTGAVGVGSTGFESDGPSYFDSTVEFAGIVTLGGAYTNLQIDKEFYLSATTEGGISIQSAQTPDAFMLSTGALSNGIVVSETGDRTYDFAHAQQTNPTLWIQSANQSATEWLSLAHNQTNASFGVGSGDFAFKDDGGKGVSSNIRTITESVTFANDATKVTTGSIMPDGAFIFGVSGRVTTLLTGCTSVSVGDGVDPDLFKNNLALAAGSTFTNADATAAFSTISGGHAPRTAAGEITVTANGGNCTAGVVALTVHYLDVTAATSN